MSLPLAPILAQLITLGVGDRTEARHIIEESGRYWEGSTSPVASLDFRWERTSLTFGYAPTITLTPLDQSPRETLIFHSLFLSGSYRLRHTTISLTQSVGFGDRDFVSESLARGTTGPDDGTPDDPNGPMTGPDDPARPDTVGARQGAVQYRTLRTDAAVDHELSTRSTLGVSAGYTYAGGTDPASRVVYPVVQGPDASVTYGYRLDRDDTLDSSLGASMYDADTGVRTWLFDLSQGWTHDFSSRTSSSLSAGISYSRGEQPSGLVVHSIYPTGSASIEHDTPLSGGNLGMGASVGTAPELDLTTAEVDPRLTVAAGIGWSKERFSIDAGVSSAVSLSQDLAGALNAFTASVTAAYDIGAGFAVDAGVRGAWQTFEGATAIPPSIAIFLGLSWGAGIPINH